jgi:hypothetical protein
LKNLCKSYKGNKKSGKGKPKGNSKKDKRALGTLSAQQRKEPAAQQ